MSSRQNEPGPKQRCKLVFAAAVILTIVVELCSYGLIAVSNGRLDEPIRRKADIYREQTERIAGLIGRTEITLGQLDPELGWVYRPEYRSSSDEINSAGIRSRRDYSVTPPAGVSRVAAFGDSYVYGTEVSNADAWPERVETMDPSLEVLNYGVGGYGTDQALLRYRREGRRFSPEIVLIGFAPVDLRRVVNVYRRFISSSEELLVKPRYLIEDGSLRLIPAPIGSLDDWRPIMESPELITAWGELDEWYQPLVYENAVHDWSATVRLISALWVRLDRRYVDADRLYVESQFNTASEAFRLQLRLLTEFADAVRANGSTPIVLFLPNVESVQAKFGQALIPYAPLVSAASEAGVQVLDALDAFPELGDRSEIGAWFAPGGHYSPLGNELIAAWLASVLTGEVREPFF